ncbi:MAG: S8 family serine peptidase [Methanophagales archaeon]|nr:S8 family serine peptidase [Methanophagales archaeon]
MPDKIRVLIQMRHTPELDAALTARRFSTSTVPSMDIPALLVDESYTPVKLPNREPRERVGDMEVGRLFTFDARPEVSTYLIRGEVEDDTALNRLIENVKQDPKVVGVFSDPRISAIAVCPQNPVGSHEDVANLLNSSTLHARGMDGSNVMVAIVDTGINVDYLRSKGINPEFDADKSWTPEQGLIPGNLPVDHGTMCAFDACIAAPNCTLLDYALLLSQAEGGSVMEGFLSDAVRAYSKLLELLSTDEQNKPALVVNNSWGMFHPSWDFPVGHHGNYSDNPDHPFNIIVESLEDAGADILFAAGNCGQECPDNRCEGVTNRPIYGANSHQGVLCIAGVTMNKVRLGYSSQGPGHLHEDKPDLCAYTHFEGSGVYAADGGTSAACPVAAGVVAAIRSVYSPTNLTPAQLRNLLRRTSEDIGLTGFDYSHGFGLINVPEIICALDKTEIRQLRVGEVVSGNLKETGATAMFRLSVGNALNIELNGPTGVDFDIYVRKGAEPTLTEYDYRGFTSSADEKIRIQPIEPGEYYAMVRSYRGSGDFSLRAVLE